MANNNKPMHHEPPPKLTPQRQAVAQSRLGSLRKNFNTQSGAAGPTNQFNKNSGAASAGGRGGGGDGKDGGDGKEGLTKNFNRQSGASAPTNQFNKNSGAAAAAAHKTTKDTNGAPGAKPTVAGHTVFKADGVRTTKPKSTTPTTKPTKRTTLTLQP